MIYDKAEGIFFLKGSRTWRKTKVEKRRVKVVLGPGKRMYVRLEAACGISVARY